MMATSSMSSGFREIQRVRLANEEEEKQMVKERERQVLRLMPRRGLVRAASLCSSAVALTGAVAVG